MKKIFFNLLTLVSVFGLMTACNKPAQESGETAESAKDSSIVSGVSDPANHIKIAFLDVTRFASEYMPAVKAMEDLRNEEAKAARDFQSRQAALEKEAANFQEKMNNNAFLSQSSAESQYNELQRKGQKLQQDYDKKAQELAIKSQNLQMQFTDTLRNYLKEFNANAKYEMIIDRAAVLISVDGYDITDEVISNLNARVADAQ